MIHTILRGFIFDFRELTSILSEKEIKLAYNGTYVLSLISFGIKAWEGAYKSVINPQIVQKTILKVAFKKSSPCPTNIIFQKTNIPSVQKIL